MSHSDPADRWVLELRPELRSVPVPARIRRLLKTARALGFRCVFVGSELPPRPREEKPGIAGIPK